MKVTTIFSQSQTTEREARIDDHRAVLEEPQDHAVTGGRDVSLHFEGGHSPEHHTVAEENTDEQQKQRTSQTRPQKQKNTLLSTTFPWIEGTYREPSITKGAMLSSDVGGSQKRSTES